MRGFSLIELAVTVVILGVVSTIALAQFIEYRYHAYHAQALSALVNARTAFEAYKTNNIDLDFMTKGFRYDSHTDDLQLSGISSIEELLPGFRYNKDVSMLVTVYGYQFNQDGLFQGNTLSCKGKTYGVSGGRPVKLWYRLGYQPPQTEISEAKLTANCLS